MMDNQTLPNFLVIGAMKASTTTFYQTLLNHPQIWMPRDKEPHYFTNPEYGEVGAWRAYASLFRDAPREAKAVGEASTGYSKLPRLGPTPERIRRDLGEPHLIYLLRDPVARAISNYRHSYDGGAYPPRTRFGEAIERDPILLSASRYYDQIAGYLEVFERDQLLILVAERFHSNPVVTLRRVEQHLGLDVAHCWPESLDCSNASRDRSASRALTKHVPDPVIRSLRACCPSSARHLLKKAIPARASAPAVSEDEQRMALEFIEDDLRRLLDFADESLRDEISAWHSIRGLTGA